MKKGQSMTAESKLKMSLSKKDKYQNGLKPFWSGKTRPDISERARKRMSGKKLSVVTKNKLSLTHSGPKHWNWRTDRNSLKKSEHKHLDAQYKEWRKAVYTRDCWKCRIENSDCKGRLEAHHILNWIDYPELRYQLNNGITLCHFHHPRGREKEKRLENLLINLLESSVSI